MFGTTNCEIFTEITQFKTHMHELITYLEEEKNGLKITTEV